MGSSPGEKKIGKIGGDGGMFETELTDSPAINNDTVQRITLTVND